jgi:hypothetical protein
VKLWRADTPMGEPQLQTVYWLRCVLEALRLRLVRVGRTQLVPRREIQEKRSPLRESICLVDKVRRAAVSDAQQAD